MLEVLREDYIRTAWSKGLSEQRVIIGHALKNSFIPVITLVGQQFSILLGGTVIIETIFLLPGVGNIDPGRGDIQRLHAGAGRRHFLRRDHGAHESPG